MSKQTLSLCWAQPGEPDSLTLSHTELPELASDEILVANRVIGLNPVDWKFIEQPFNLWEAGHIPGVDAMGTVAAVGARVRHLRVGSRVCYHTNLRTNGSFSHHTVISAKAAIPVPDGVTDEAAAAIPCPGLTAWQALKKVPELKGKRVLVSGAGGSVGSILTQLLIEQGALVYATASETNHARLGHWGVIQAFDYRQSDWRQQLRQQLVLTRCTPRLIWLAANMLPRWLRCWDTMGIWSAFRIASIRRPSAHLPPVFRCTKLRSVRCTSTAAMLNGLNWCRPGRSCWLALSAAR